MSTSTNTSTSTSTPRRLRSAGVALLAAGLITTPLAVARSADAVGACPANSLPANYEAPTDPALNFWEFEGKIAAVNESARTVTVNGATFHIPDDLLVKTESLDQTEGNLTLADLMNPELPTVVGAATVIATGQAAYSTTAEGQQCVRFEADSVYVEFAENVLVGVLVDVASDGSSLTVAGSTVEVNSDPRFPSIVTDATGEPLALEDFAGREGLLLETEGYFSSSQNALQATHIATDEILKDPGTVDVVTIVRAQWKSRELRVTGQVSPVEAGKSVSVYPGEVVAGACDASGSLLGTAAVDPVDGSYNVRNRNEPANPQMVCVASSGGGVRSAAVQVQ